MYPYLYPYYFYNPYYYPIYTRPFLFRQDNSNGLWTNPLLNIEEATENNTNLRQPMDG